MGLEQQFDLFGKWFYPVEQTSDNGNCPINICEQTNLIIESMFKRNHRRHQLTWQGATLLAPEEQRKQTRTSLCQISENLERDVAFDSDNRPVLLSFTIPFQKRYQGAQH
ncbi:hypothetical protein RB195_025031 [Necator americanus]|uniref:Uncharacterized protein n=1 Tax=Necator americanus TaxID=51031 RepID=A0ABR1EQN8_NECAM